MSIRLVDQASGQRQSIYALGRCGYEGDEIVKRYIHIHIPEKYFHKLAIFYLLMEIMFSNKKIYIPNNGIYTLNLDLHSSATLKPK